MSDLGRQGTEKSLSMLLWSAVQAFSSSNLLINFLLLWEGVVTTIMDFLCRRFS